MPLEKEGGDCIACLPAVRRNMSQIACVRPRTLKGSVDELVAEFQLAFVAFLQGQELQV